jgi:hypothetical protein
VLALWMLWIALAASLPLTMVDWPFMFMLTGGMAAAAATSASIIASTDQLNQTPKSFRCLLLLSIALGFFVLLQTVPLKLVGLANPIWSAAGAAIGQPTAGCITVDIIATVLGLAKYLIIVGTSVTVAVACNTANRRIQYLFAVVLLLAVFCVSSWMFKEFRLGASAARLSTESGDLPALGILAAISLLIQPVLRSGGRASSRSWLSRDHLIASFLSIAMISIFAASLSAQASRNVAIPTIVGIAALLTAILAKRFTSGPSGAIFIVGAVACILWLASVLTGVFSRAASVLGPNTESEIATVLRVFRDFRWFGSGLGTYSAVLPMYTDIHSNGHGLLSTPPAGLSLLIELGTPLSVLAAALIAALACVVLSKLARAHREWTPSALACSTLVYLLTAALTPGASLSFPTMIAAAMMLGTALTIDARPLRMPTANASNTTLRWRPSKRSHPLPAEA